jgi:Spy/CpxP family protein refolding chaperone
MNFFEKPKILTFIIMALLVLNFATLAFMWFHRPPHPREMGPDMDRMHEGPPGHERGPEREGGPADFIQHELNFNQQQKDQFENLKKEHQDAMKNVHDDMKKNKDEIFSYITKGQNDSVKINQLADNIGKDQKQIELATYTHFQKVRAMCDDTQKKKFDGIIGEVLRMMTPPDPEHRPPPH